jgi:hypothetical protein
MATHVSGLRRARHALARAGIGLTGFAATTALAWAASAAEPEDGAKAPAPECPPGAFCEEASTANGAKPADEKQQSDASPNQEAAGQAKDATADDGSVTVVLPPSSSEEPRVVVVKQRPGGGPPEVVAYEGFRRPLPEAPPAPDVTRVKRPDPIGSRHWGFTMRGSGLILPKYRDDISGPVMGGGGLSVKYRPLAPLALDAGIDMLMGYDSNGLARREIPLTLSLMLYLFPRSVVQPYALVGLGTTFARVEAQTPQWNLAQGNSARYTYVGGHAGLGIELRLAPVVGLSLDGVAFVRERVDGDARKYPELYDRNTGEGSNTSVGGQVRGGLTFWW